jgi:hypothetical protein
MGHKNPNPNYRINKLTETASSLIGKQLAQVLYHDSADDDGKAIFSFDTNPNRHELMQGVDLVMSDGTTAGFYWKWFKDYELEVTIEGVGAILNTGWAPFDQSNEEHWAHRINKTISSLTFSKTTDGYLCDCRIDFKGADPIWICARQGTNNQDPDNFVFNGDDIIVVFTEQEARRIGIKADAE